MKFVHRKELARAGEQSKASGSENAIVKCTINRRLGGGGGGAAGALFDLGKFSPGEQEQLMYVP